MILSYTHIKISLKYGVMMARLLLINDIAFKKIMYNYIIRLRLHILDSFLHCNFELFGKNYSKVFNYLI